MNARCLKVLSLLLTLALAAFATAQAQKASAAEEEKAKACKDNGECDRSQYCHRRAGKCNGPGRCVVRPQNCIEIFDPVCGCDGRTYSNFCFAAQAGVNVRHAGPCEPKCTSNADCKGKEYCAKPTGRCKGKGECATRPDVCPLIFDPVCGCDGKTYGNACEAASVGVSVASLGECKK